MTVTAFTYQILEDVMRHNKEVIPKQRLLDVLYGDDDDEGDPNTIEVMISRLRKKLTFDEQLNPITTIRGQGYKFNLKCQ